MKCNRVGETARLAKNPRSGVRSKGVGGMVVITAGFQEVGELHDEQDLGSG